MSEVQPFDTYATTANASYLDLTPRDVPSKARVGYRVQLSKGEDGWIVARCLDLPSAISQGRNQDEALKNIVEAIEAVLEDESGGKEMPEFFVAWQER